MLTNVPTGLDTLHGGIYGWDRRNWTIVERTVTSVIYKHIDSADEGFPGDVTVFVRISLLIKECCQPDALLTP